jgi:hypothetical protein
MTDRATPSDRPRDRPNPRQPLSCMNYNVAGRRGPRSRQPEARWLWCLYDLADAGQADANGNHAGRTGRNRVSGTVRRIAYSGCDARRMTVRFGPPIVGDVTSEGRRAALAAGHVIVPAVSRVRAVRHSIRRPVSARRGTFPRPYGIHLGGGGHITAARGTAPPVAGACQRGDGRGLRDAVRPRTTNTTRDQRTG